MAHRVTWHLRLLRQLICLTTMKNLQQVPELYRYDTLNLLSYFTPDVKNILSVVHQKDTLFTMLDYPRNFGNLAKKGLIRTAHGAAYYFTNPNSWYLVPERARIPSAIPTIQPLPPVPMAQRSIRKMRDWA